MIPEELFEGIPEEQKSQATILVDLCSELLFVRDEQDRAFAIVPIGDHSELKPIRSHSMQQWLMLRYYAKKQNVPSTAAVQAALSLIEARALQDGEKRVVPLRVFSGSDRVVVDLCDDTWKAVSIDKTGWTVGGQTAIIFRRSRGMHPLPEPKRGGSLDLLRNYLNVTDTSFALLISWLVAAFSKGPFPVLCLRGEQGTAKSTAARILRALVDPNVAPLRSQPKEPRDVQIAADNALMLAFDNLSSMQPWFSDALCCLSTGGGFATRQLYTDRDEAIFNTKRPVILTSIEDVAARGDLLDRALILALDVIPEGQRRSERSLFEAFELDRPFILGALLDAVAMALERLPDVLLLETPRMADFTQWVVAACPALPFPEDTFIQAYRDNRSDAHALALEGSLVADLIRQIAGSDKDGFEGSALELLRRCRELAVNREKELPRSPRALAGQIRRLAPNLRATGVSVMELPRTGASRPWRLWLNGKVGPESSQSSPSSPLPAEEIHDSVGPDEFSGASFRDHVFRL